MLRGIRRRIEITPTVPLAKRFLQRVDASGGPDACWRFMLANGNGASSRGNGYGAMKVGGRLVSTHCIAYVLAFGEIPEGRIVAHKCDNRACCNPDHLEAITPGENNRDADERLGRQYARGEASATAVLTVEDVKQIRSLAKGGLGYVRIARKLGLNRNTVKGVVYRRTWKHIS